MVNTRGDEIQNLIKSFNYETKFRKNSLDGVDAALGLGPTKPFTFLRQFSKAGEKGGHGGGQNTWGPDWLGGRRNLGKPSGHGCGCKEGGGP